MTVRVDVTLVSPVGPRSSWRLVTRRRQGRRPLSTLVAARVCTTSANSGTTRQGRADVPSSACAGSASPPPWPSRPASSCPSVMARRQRMPARRRLRGARGRSRRGTRSQPMRSGEPVGPLGPNRTVTVMTSRSSVAEPRSFGPQHVDVDAEREAEPDRAQERLPPHSRRDLDVDAEVVEEGVPRDENVDARLELGPHRARLVRDLDLAAGHHAGRRHGEVAAALDHHLVGTASRRTRRGGRRGNRSGLSKAGP